MQLDQPFVSVIIPHLNDHDRLLSCLRALDRQTYPHNRFEIIVVDNGSRLPIDPIIQRFPRAKGALELEKGCGSARNRGVAEARGNIFAFTDSDCLPDPGWLENAIAYLITGKADVVGGDIKVFCRDEHAPTDVELFDKVFGFEQARYVRWKHFAAGANIVTTRAVFEENGPFLNGTQPEDLEWGKRAWKKGFRIAFAPDAVIRHPARRSWLELQRKVDRTVYHNRNFLKDKGFFHARWLAYTAALSSPPLIKMWIIATTPLLARTEYRWKAMRTLFRFRYYRASQMAGSMFRPDPIGQDRPA